MNINQSEVGCEDVVNSSQCTISALTELNLKCIWVNDNPTVKCETIKSTCEDISLSNICEIKGAADSGDCIWISEEEEGQQCQRVKSSCEQITRETTCGLLGASGSGDTTLDCFWLYDFNDNNMNNGKCRAKDDESLNCNEAQRSVQCTNMSINKFGMNCFWLEGDSTNSIPSKCTIRV
jgi:hypothetical protein